MTRRKHHKHHMTHSPVKVSKMIQGKDGKWITIQPAEKDTQKNTGMISTSTQPTYTPPQNYTSYPSSSTSTYVTCNVTHSGDEVIWTKVDDKGNRLEFVIGDVPGWKEGIKTADIVLDLNNNVTTQTRKLVLSAPARFLKLNDFMPPPPKAEVIKLDWPDFKSVDAPLAFWQELLRLLPLNGRVMITCHGGHGRSGTCLAAIMIASGFSCTDAVVHIRKHHCKKAVESTAQEDYLFDLSIEAGETVELNDFIKAIKNWNAQPEDKKSTVTTEVLYDYCKYCGGNFKHPEKTNVCQDCWDQGKGRDDLDIHTDWLPFGG